MEQTTHELPMLAGIGAALRWCEELVTIASGPILTAGLAIALVDLLTDGKLLASQPALLYGWAVSQSVGVDGQLVGAAVRCGRAMRSHHPWIAAACIPLIAALGYVAYLASNVFATQQALGITTQAALGRLGMDGTTWIVTRSALAVVLVILSGMLRYDPAKPAVETAQEREEREARELAQARHKAELRAVKAAGMRTVLEAGIGRVNPLDTVGETHDTETTNRTEDAADTVQMQPVRRRNNPGTKAVPSDMMSAPQFRAYLAENDVPISDRKACAIVQSAVGSAKVGNTYCARKAALMRVANRMIEASNSAGNDQERDAAADTDTLAG